MFLNKNLSVLSYANGFTMWHYVSDDKIDDILSHTYFDKVKGLIHTGDIIIIFADEVYAKYVASIDETGIKFAEIKK